MLGILSRITSHRFLFYKIRGGGGVSKNVRLAFERFVIRIPAATDRSR